MSENISIPRAGCPEDVGVSSREILAFLEDAEKNGVNLHTFMIIRHGKVAAECYRAPFDAQTPHAMYSVSKTFTSTALGIAVGEGLLSLDDKVRDFFPEFTESIKDERLDKMTVRHLVSMQAGKEPGILSDKTKDSWIEDFFKSRWREAPGEKYRYISENTYMISAIIKKITGLSLRDYLEPRLFEPLGIDYPFWETDKNGIEAGGWGLYVKTEDLAKLMLCYHQNGVWNGKQVIPADYVKEASSFQSDNYYNTSPDYNVGYGYGLWMCREKDRYRADGMFSQFGIVFKDYDAIVVTTSGIPLEQEALDLIWRHFPAAFNGEKDDAARQPDETCDKLKNAVLDSPPDFTYSPLEERINGRTARFRKKLFLNLIGFPVSILPLAVTFMLPDKCGNIDNMVFDFEKDAVNITWTEKNDKNTVKAGMNGRFCYGTMRLGGIDYKVCSSAEWLDNRRLYVQIRPVETIGKRMLDIKFRDGGKVTMKPLSTPSAKDITKYIQLTFNDTNKSIPLRKAVAAALKLLPAAVEPVHRGKFIN